MQIPLKRGRFFTAQEAAEMRHVVVINEAFARQNLPNEDPFGKRLTIYMKNENVPCEIVGVVGDVKQETLDGPVKPMSFCPHAELAYPFMTLVIRTQGNAASLAPAVRGVIESLDREQPVSDVRTMEGWLARSTARVRFSTLLLAVFAGFAAALAGVGIYGVMAYAVTQRTHELGVRIALGAQRDDVLRLVLGQGARLALSGVGAGLLAAFGLTRLMQSLFFGVSAAPFTFAAVAVLLTLVALVACYLTARQASNVDPMVALQDE